MVNKEIKRFCHIVFTSVLQQTRLEQNVKSVTIKLSVKIQLLSTLIL